VDVDGLVLRALSRPCSSDTSHVCVS